jgi:hypothetical protein
LAFRFARADLMHIFEAAAQTEAKKRDTGPSTRSQGIAFRGSSQEFDRTGSSAEFTAAVQENPDYFRGWLGALESNPIIGNTQA